MNDFETAKQFFLQGLQSVEANDLASAEAMFTRSLEILPERVSTLNNLSAVKIKLGKFSEAETFARKAISIEADSPEAWSNIGLALTATDRHEEALDACDRALKSNPSDIMAWLAKIVTLRALNRFNDALLACDEALKLDPKRHEVLYNKSLALKELERPEEAQQVYQQALNARVALSPVFIGDRCETQKGAALIVNRSLAVDDSFRSFDSLSRNCQNYPGQLSLHLNEDFQFNSIFFTDSIQPSTRTKIPKPDFIINNHVDAELLASLGQLPALTEFIDSFGVPVVNHPAKAVQTGREDAAKFYGDIPGVIVPKTMRFSSQAKTRQALAREIEDQFTFPIITRTVTGHEGVGMSKVDSHDSLMKVLSAGDCPDNLFVTQFIDTRGNNPHYRKVRAAGVGDEIIVLRADFSDNWNVHGRKKPKRWAFYKENPHLLEEEKRICHDSEATLGRTAVDALRAIRERHPLDIFGIDFDVDGDGRLIFYEANAAMNLFSTAPKEIPNPKEAGDRLKMAVQRYFASLVGS
ncbi:MAG: hypothetical protein JWO95_3294 [Verrucomicrobiales bacterium]|nr:hypothetical protein [Verrucomicrobiales bacterium]